MKSARQVRSKPEKVELVSQQKSHVDSRCKVNNRIVRKVACKVYGEDGEIVGIGEAKGVSELSEAVRAPTEECVLRRWRSRRGNAVEVATYDFRDVVVQRIGEQVEVEAQSG